jgi:hypothetical protein
MRTETNTEPAPVWQPLQQAKKSAAGGAALKKTTKGGWRSLPESNLDQPEIHNMSTF